MQRKLIDFEPNLHQMKLTGGSQDVFRNPSKLYAHFGFLYSDVETSWGGVGSDWPPTEVHELLKERLRNYQGQFGELMSSEVTIFNALLAENNLNGIVALSP